MKRSDRIIVIIFSKYALIFQLTVLAKLDDMKKVLVLKAKYKTDTRLIKEGVRSYLYCISNLKKSISESFEGNSTGSFSLSNVVNTTKVRGSKTKNLEK